MTLKLGGVFVTGVLGAVGALGFLVGCSSLSTSSFTSTSTSRGTSRESERQLAQAGAPVVSDPVMFFYTPQDMHRTWLRTISGAKKSIFMEMFHLTDPQIVSELRAKGPEVDIQIILDSGNLKDPATAQIAASLSIGRPNIKVFPSSGPPAGFVQTHTKSMVVDGSTALITSINLTNNAAVQRDYGIQTQDGAVIAEMVSVFNADIQNSQNVQNGQQPVKFTPPGVGLGKLIWSPVDSQSRLVSLIGDSLSIPEGPNKFIYATVENLGDAPIQNALSKAALGGVDVRIIVPQCVLGANGPRNYSFFPNLKNGVQYKVMPHPSSAIQPYMHGKMMLLGNGEAYIGSVNYSKNSTQGNRELGIIFTNQQVAGQLLSVFVADWGQAVAVADPSVKPTCPTGTSDPSQ
jgi:phosphatidylserine/phosphatidylglycerophosphate/cardiolipin synthase-like enzyme